MPGRPTSPAGFPFLSNRRITVCASSRYVDAIAGEISRCVQRVPGFRNEFFPAGLLRVPGIDLDQASARRSSKSGKEKVAFITDVIEFGFKIGIRGLKSCSPVLRMKASPSDRSPLDVDERVLTALGFEPLRHPLCVPDEEMSLSFSLWCSDPVVEQLLIEVRVFSLFVSSGYRTGCRTRLCHLPTTALQRT